MRKYTKYGWFLTLAGVAFFFISCHNDETRETVHLVIGGVAGEAAWGPNNVIAVGDARSILYRDAGGGPVNEIKPDPPIDVYELDWSPDGKTIICAGLPSGAAETSLYKIKFPNGDASLFLSGGISAPAWSPDGRTIAYVKWPGGDAGTVELIPADGGTPAVIAAGGKFYNPSWTADSRRVVFSQYFDESQRHVVWSVDIETKDKVYVTEGFDPKWAPGGDWLAVTRQDPDEYSVYLVSPKEGTEIRFIGPVDGVPDASARWPAWSPDGKWLACCADRGEWGIYKKQ